MLRLVTNPAAFAAARPGTLRQRLGGPLKGGGPAGWRVPPTRAKSPVAGAQVLLVLASEQQSWGLAFRWMSQRVTGGNTVGEYIFSELTWTADIVAALWS